MEKVLKDFIILTKKPENFLGSNNTSCNGFKGVAKGIFDYNINCLKDKNLLPIHELIVNGFDDEQIWQELELLNGVERPALTREVSQATALTGQLRLSVRPLCAATADSAEEDAESDASHGDAQQEDVSDDAEEDGEDDASHGDAQQEDVSDADDDDMEDMEGGRSDEESEDEEQESEELEDGERGSGAGEPMPPRPRGQGSAVDDQFFRLEELEQFLERQDRQFERERACKPGQHGDGERELDLFTECAGDDSRTQQDEEDAFPMFSDFFDPPVSGLPATSQQTRENAPTGKSNDLLASESEGEDAADILGNAKKDEPKSTLEARQERLKSRISQLEEQNLAEKPWQQRGETSAATRHENALLEEYVDFEQTRRAPETTAEVTAELERLILRRIKDNAFDDVERKVKPVRDPYDFKKRLVMDQEKSKLSLAQIYEQEYLKQKTEAEAKPEVDLGLAHDEVEDVPKVHEEIKKMMTELFAKLDTLTHFHYQPKQASAEVRIISKLPSIAMEEVTPLGASNATLLAPEEIKDKKRSQLLAKEERTDTDKKRERRKKKHRQSVKAKAKEQKERLAAAQTPEGRAAVASRLHAEAQVAKAARHGTVSRAEETGGKRALKSSTAFFSQLQDTVTSQLDGSQPAKKKRKKKVVTSADVARLRL